MPQRFPTAVRNRKPSFADPLKGFLFFGTATEPFPDGIQNPLMCQDFRIPYWIFLLIDANMSPPGQLSPHQR